MQRMERIELASMLLADAKMSAGILQIRVRQMAHRLPGRYGELIQGAYAELDRIIDACNDAHEQIGEELQAQQAARTVANG
jgi:hypothetical protein